MSFWDFFKSKPTSDTCYHIHGYASCFYFRRAVCVANELKEKHPGICVTVEEIEQKKWREHLNNKKQELGEDAASHKTSPIVFEGCTPNTHNFIGGSDDFVTLVQTKHNYQPVKCKI